MKNKTSQYFGNRIANALRARASKASKKSIISSPAMVEVSSEFESLESRILLSGIGTGLNKKSVTFYDAAGDKVKVSIAGAKGATFNIDLGGATNNADISDIQINGNGSLAVQVTPVGSFTKPVVTQTINSPTATLNIGGGDLNAITFGNGNHNIALRTQTSEYVLTPGYTEIGQITVKAGVTQIGSINLVAADVQDINLTGVTAGNINLSTGLVAKVDQTLHKNLGGNDPGYVLPDAGIDHINLHNIEAASLGNININGYARNNNFDGDITVASSIGSITGVQSDLNGQIDLTGANSSLGNIVVGSFGNGFGIYAGGNLTIQNAAGISGVIQTVGNFNFGVNGGAFTGSILAGGNVEGLHSGSPILITNGSFSGQIGAAGDIGSILLTNASLTNATIHATSIGDLTVGNGSSVANTTFSADSMGVISSTHNGFEAGNRLNITGELAGLNFDGGIAFSVTAGSIGEITVANGDIAGNITASTIGNVSVTNGNITGTITAATSIADVTIDSGSLEGPAGAIAAGPGGIGAISISSTGLGDAISGTIASGGDITSITATALYGNAINSGDGNGYGVGNGNGITAVGNIGAISATGSTGAIVNSSITAGSITSITASSPIDSAIVNTAITSSGAIGAITATAFNTGIQTSSVTGSSIGAISGTSTAKGDGIGANTSFTAITGSIASVAGIAEGTGSGINGGNDSFGSAFFGAATTIGPVTGTSSGAYGITGADFSTSTGNVGALTATGPEGGLNYVTVESGAAIGNITVNSIAGVGIGNSHFTAATSMGTISSTAGGDAISGSIFTAYQSIGAITATAQQGVYGVSGSGILSSQFVAYDIASVTATSVTDGASAIQGSSFVTHTLGNVSATTASGDAIGSNTYFFGSISIGDITATATKAGGSAINGNSEGGQVDIESPIVGNITANVNDNFGGVGIANLLVNQSLGFVVDHNQEQQLSVTGSVGAITVTSSSLINSAIVDSTIESAGDIGAITVTSASNLNAPAAIDTTNFFAGNSIASISVTSVGRAINDSNFTAGNNYSAYNSSAYAAPAFGNIGNITVAVSGISVDGIDNSQFAGSNIGNIQVELTGTTQNGTAVYGSTFTAFGLTQTAANSGIFNSTGSIGTITVSTSAVGSGNGIVNSGFDAGAGGTGIGAITVTTDGNGISGSTFNAASNGVNETLFTGSIGAITITAGYDGITQGSEFLAANAIGDIVVNASANGIVDSTFTANDLNRSESGVIGTITVTSGAADGTFAGIGEANSSDNNGIGQELGTGASFYGTQIGNISVTMNATSGQNYGIYNASFTAETGTPGVPNGGTSGILPNGIGQDSSVATLSDVNNTGLIGDIKVINKSTTEGSEGIYESYFLAGAAAAGGIGDISVTTAGGVGILIAGFSASGTTASQNDLGASIGAITVTTTGASIEGTSAALGILDAAFSAANNIGQVTVNSVGTAIENSAFGASTTFNTTNYATVATNLQNGDFENVVLNNVGTIAGVSVTVAAQPVTATALGSNGISDSNFIAAAIGNISVTLNATNGGKSALDQSVGIFNSGFLAYTHTETSAGSGIYNDLGTIGTITVTNDSTNEYANGIQTSSFLAGSGSTGIGTVTVTTAGGDGINYSVISASNGDLPFNIAGGQTQGQSGFDTETLYTSKIGAISVTAGGAGIVNSEILSETGIATGTIVADTNSATDSIYVSSVKDGIYNTTIEGHNAAENVADYNGTAGAFATIGGISVTVSGIGSTGINSDNNNDYYIEADTVGPVSVNMTATTGASEGISNVQFYGESWNNLATGQSDTGTVGNITVDVASTDKGAYGINNVHVESGDLGSIGNITVTTAGGTGISDGVFEATNEGTVTNSGNTGGTIGAISATNILGSTISAVTGITSITATTGDLTGDFAVYNGNASITATKAVNVGNIYVSGELTLSNMTSVTSFGELTAGSLASSKSEIVIGAGTADTPTGTIGAILIETDLAGTSGTPQYQFQFENFANPNPVTVGTLPATVQDITPVDVTSVVAGTNASGSSDAGTLYFVTTTL